MLLNLTRAHRVLFVGGKGGVGKTSVSSALALAHAEGGAKVLLVSTDPAHNLGHLWEQNLGDDPVRLHTAEMGTTDADTTHAGFIDGVEIDPQRTVNRHLASVGEMMEQLLPERMHGHAKKHLELAREAPGSHEAAVLERIADLVNLGLESYDLVIFDTAPTGHTLRLLSLPGQLTGWTETLLTNRDRSERFSAALRGLATTKDEDPQRSADAQLRHTLVKRRKRFAQLQQTLTDSTLTGFVIVLTPERIPVLETLELAQSLRAAGIGVTALVANRRSPKHAGGLLADRHDMEQQHLARLTQAEPDIPLFEIPLLAEEPVGVAGLALITAQFSN